MRLTVDGQTLTAPLEVRPDPRVKVPQADLGEQVRLALAVRDDFNKLSGAVEQLRAIRKQLQDRNAVLKDLEKAKPLAKASSGFIAKLDALEGKMHNPKAQVTYDILAMKGVRPALLQPGLALRDSSRGRRTAHAGHARGGRADGGGAG